MGKASISEQILEKINTPRGVARFYNLSKLSDLNLGNVSKLPYSLRILLEAVIRHNDGKIITEDDIKSLLEWKPNSKSTREIPFIPSRVILQDFTGVPAVVDLAALRSAMDRAGKDASKINPQIPVDLIIDHSVQVDYFAREDAEQLNVSKEFERNQERYKLLKWAQAEFDNFRVVPPSKGICHQINLEYLGAVMHARELEKELVVVPDSVVGTDSHTPTINGLGILGWGVGGIEAEAVMLGQPYYMPIPEVVGVKLTGKLQDGITATDVVLTVTQILRKHGVVGKFVEYFGPGLKTLDIANRATISNMTPEYGATVGFFPVDEKTLEYLELSGRKSEHVKLIRDCLVKMGIFHNENAPVPNYSEIVEINLNEVQPSLAGPNKPVDRIPLRSIQEAFKESMVQKFGKEKELNDIVKITTPVEKPSDINHGFVSIAAITSCTNTSNPYVMIGAGLLAKNAVQKGLKVKKFVKTSLAPGSRVVTRYLKDSGLLQYLEKLGFNLVAYGCTTCIGNSGPLPDEIVKEINDRDLVIASVVSGNRNFEGRISPHVKASYLCSPPLVVAFAMAGTVSISMDEEPLGIDENGMPIYLKDIWPKDEDIQELVKKHVKQEFFKDEYSKIFKGNELWNELESPKQSIYKWDASSTYIKEPPFFKNFPLEIPPQEDIKNARIITLLGDTITTDHISPAGAIPKGGPAASYLVSIGVKEQDFNSFGSRRGNHEVMMRGTFGNIRIRNKLVDKEGGWTNYLPSGEILPIYDAAMRYKKENTPLIVIGGKEYGTGSSRDWAAKGTILLGIKAVIAESYERIHRSNLVGMGVLPLQFKEGENASSLGLSGKEIISISGITDLKPGKELEVIAERDDGDKICFKTITRLDTAVEIEYFQNKGILHYVLRNFINK
ncbi:MAG: aconitate hydratase AcnA [Candidatus Hodarchaeota archaeon]